MLKLLLLLVLGVITAERSVHLIEVIGALFLLFVIQRVM